MPAEDEQWPSPAMLKASLSADDSRAMAGQQLPPGLKVLLVEDSAVSQKVGKHMLAQLGAAVVIAKNGEQGLRIWEQDHFDIILMDYHVRKPVMNGRDGISHRLLQPQDAHHGRARGFPSHQAEGEGIEVAPYPNHRSIRPE